MLTSNLFSQARFTFIFLCIIPQQKYCGYATALGAHSSPSCTFSPAIESRLRSANERQRQPADEDFHLVSRSPSHGSVYLVTGFRPRPDESLLVREQCCFPRTQEEILILASRPHDCSHARTGLAVVLTKHRQLPRRAGTTPRKPLHDSLHLHVSATQTDSHGDAGDSSEYICGRVKPTVVPLLRMHEKWSPTDVADKYKFNKSCQPTAVFQMVMQRLRLPWLVSVFLQIPHIRLLHCADITGE